MAIVVVACSLFRVDNGISADEAIRIAAQHAGPTAVFLAIERGMSGQWMPSEPSRSVWAVSFSGNWPMECPAPAPGLPPPLCPNVHNATVVIDFESGEFITAEYT